MVVATASKQELGPGALRPLDIATYNHEVRCHDDTSTWLAEVLDGSMRSEFTYVFDGQELIARDGRPLGVIFTKAVEDAEEKMAQDPSWAFELRRRIVELEEYQDMIAMAEGELPNTMVVLSDHPEDLWDKENDTLGYNVTRRKTMMRVIKRNQDGTVTVTSQSLDGSNREALESIYNFLGSPVQRGELLGQRIYQNMDEEYQDNLCETLTRVYDSDLKVQFGGEWYAGRNPSERTNTMLFAVRQRDLITAYLSGSQDDRAKFNLAAAVTARYETTKTTGMDSVSLGRGTSFISVAIEMEQRGRFAAIQGKTFSGCGGSVRRELGPEEELSLLGFGDDEKVEKQEWYGKFKKTGTCVNCNEGPKDVGEKSWCKDCIGGHCGTK